VQGKQILTSLKSLSPTPLVTWGARKARLFGRGSDAAALDVVDASLAQGGCSHLKLLFP
jgi:hypothetical protein